MNWTKADTSAYLLLSVIFGDALYNSMIYGVTMDSIGKTFSAKDFQKNNHSPVDHKVVMYVDAKETSTRKKFVSALFPEHDEISVGWVEDTIKDEAKRSDILIIVDNAQYLTDGLIHYIIQFYAHTSNQVGIVLLGNESFRTSVEEGVKLKIDGYTELWEHLKRRFVSIDKISDRDVEVIARVNGITDKQHIKVLSGIYTDNLSGIRESIEDVLKEVY